MVINEHHCLENYTTVVTCGNLVNVMSPFVAAAFNAV